MKTAFKVATVFTGAAACAAVFTPAAMAATTAKTQLIEVDTGHHNCAVGPRTTSTVFWWLSTAHHGPTCVGGEPDYRVGTNLGGTYFASVCPGNNYGTIYYTDGLYSGYSPSEQRGPVDGYVKSVNIWSWSGGDTCST
jgi:hypothetical protein